MWLDDLQRCLHHQVVPKVRREEKQNEDLLARQREEELQSLRKRESRKKIDESAFSSATEVPKDYVPEEQMKITRGQSGRKIQTGSSLRDLQIPERTPETTTSSSSTSSSSTSSSSTSSSSTSSASTSTSSASTSTSSASTSTSSPSTSSSSTSSSSDHSTSAPIPISPKPSSPDSPQHKKSTGGSNPSSALPSPSTSPASFNFTVDTTSSPSKPLSTGSPKSGGRKHPLAPLSTSAHSSPEKSPVHSPTSQGSSAFSLKDPKDIHEWLSSVHSTYAQYGKLFEENGLSLDFITSGQVTDQDLSSIGITNALHRKRILYEIEHRRYKREHDDESPASEPEDDPSEPIQSHVPVLTVDDSLLNNDIITPPPPPDTVELPPPPPEDGGRVYPPPPG
jgi:hypothetical protein